MSYKPGSWHVEHHPNGYHVKYGWEQKHPLLPNSLGTTLVRVSEEDDARLIAAAPDLYEALREIAEWGTPYSVEDEEQTEYGAIKTIARAALAKATGDEGTKLAVEEE